MEENLRNQKIFYNLIKVLVQLKKRQGTSGSFEPDVQFGRARHE